MENNINVQNEKKPYEKFAVGLFILRSDNANFNADFSGSPRTLPDGTIYATDKSLKYCIRKYINDLFSSESDKNILMWRQFKKGNPSTLKDILVNNNILIGKDSNLDVIKLFNNFIDVRLFGATIAVSNNNRSFTGPVQITYGIDRYNEGISYNLQILAPFSTGSGSKKNTTIGSETRATEVHYSFDITINPNNIIKNPFVQSLDETKSIFLYKNDINIFKEALTQGVNYVTSCTKVGSFGELFIYIEFKKEDKDLVPLTPILSKLIRIEKKLDYEGIKRIIKLENLITYLNSYKELIEHIELYYEPEIIELDEGKQKIKDLIENFHIYNILTLKEINDVGGK